MKMESQEKINLIKLAKDVAIAGGAEALNYFRKANLQINNKDPFAFDPVTQADMASEDEMRKCILKVRPNDTIIGEERGISEGVTSLTWVLDPIDGTRAFISGIPVWTVLVSISMNDIPVLGVIYQPFTQEMFVGGFGVSDYIRNNISIKASVRRRKGLKESYLATTFPEIGTISERESFEAVAKEVKLCRYGMDAYAYGLLALGHLDIVIEAGLKPYDVRAPIAVIEAAGGIVTDWYGGPAVNGGKLLACGDKFVHSAAVKILSR